MDDDRSGLAPSAQGRWSLSLTLANLLKRAESLLRRRAEAAERARSLDGLEVRESDWSAWQDAQGKTEQSGP
ncbi:MAG TPA: hypothetical protein VJN44_21710 [Roseateles sp.]|nr:hypothetical protein [Roseateles sp.]